MNAFPQFYAPLIEALTSFCHCLELYKVPILLGIAGWGLSIWWILKVNYLIFNFLSDIELLILFYLYREISKDLKTCRHWVVLMR